MYKQKFPLFLSIIIITSATFLNSCTKPDINFGQSYLDNSFTNIVSVDTATPVISTVFVDSFATSNTGNAVIGTYTDPYFGTVSAQSYFPIVPPAFSDIYGKSTFDSLELIIKLNKSFYGDTTKPLQINVNQLTDRIVYAENKTELYNVNSFPVADAPLGTKTVTIRPSVTDTVSIRLADAKGIELLDKFRNLDNDVKTSEQFLNYFKGLRISTGITPAYMLGFSDSIIMRLHYRVPDVIQQSKTIDFKLADKALHFNEIKINRSSTVLSGLSHTNNEISSTQTNNAGFLQSATGSVVKVRFPYLKDFLMIKSYLKVVKAQLIIKPVNGTFTGLYPLPPQLRLSETTQLNQMGNDVSTSTSGTATVEYGGLYIDELYGLNTAYTYDVTNYIIAQLAVATNNQNGLLISPPAPAYSTTFNRLLLGDKNNTKGSIQLKLYYLTVAK